MLAFEPTFGVVWLKQKALRTYSWAEDYSSTDPNN